jgi:hypothetical protein
LIVSINRMDPGILYITRNIQRVCLDKLPVSGYLSQHLGEDK